MIKKEMVAVKTADNHYPLVSIWHPSIEEKLQQVLEQRRLSVMQFLNEVQTTWIDGSLLTDHIQLVFKNINREKELERGEKNECNG